MKKLAVFFPGIGYTVDKPLLHYSCRLAAARGYEIRPVSYAGFPANVLGDSDKMTECYRIALRQAQESLADVEWSTYDDSCLSARALAQALLLGSCPKTLPGIVSGWYCSRHWRRPSHSRRTKPSCLPGRTIPGSAERTAVSRASVKSGAFAAW